MALKTAGEVLRTSCCCNIYSFYMVLLLPKGCLIEEIRIEVLECQRDGLFWGAGNPDGSTPEWKAFVKIAGFGGVAAKNWVDIQLVVFFGMTFGPGNPKNNMKEEPEGRVQIRIAKPADI